MSAAPVAERYAQAFLELGEESGNLTELSDAISEFALLYESNRLLRSTLSNPTITFAERESIIAEIAKNVGVPQIGINGLKLMSRRHRLSALKVTAARLVELTDERNGILRAEVVTALKMPSAYYSSLTSQLEAASKKTVVLESSVNRDLVGGAIVQVGDTIIDGSVRGKLARIERELVEAVVASAT